MPRDQYDAVTIDILVPMPMDSADLFTDPSGTEGHAFISGARKNNEGEDEYFEQRVPVQRFTKEHLDRNKGRGAKTLRAIEPSRLTNILNFIEFIRAVRDKDTLASEKALIQLAGAVRNQWVSEATKAILKDRRTGPGFVPNQLIYYLSQHLQGIRLVIWHGGENLAPALFCPDVETALLLHSALSALGAHSGLRLCPKCGSPFLQQTSNQFYHSIKCREAHRVERWRAKKAEGVRAKREGSRLKRRKAR